MSKIFNAIFILGCILFSTTCMAETDNKLWYAGITAGFSSDSETISEKGGKYGLLGGYQLTQWLSLEAEVTMHKTRKERFDDTYSTSYVDFTQQYKFAFMGLRANKYLSDTFGFTARLGAGYTIYKSNFERESMLNISSAVGIFWRIKGFILAQELQQIRYPIANSLNDNDVSINLSLKYRF